MKRAEVLQIRTINGIRPKGLQLYDKWLREKIRSGKTIDVILRELIPASGGTFENPAVNYFQTETAPQLIAENVAQVFLGTGIQCAQCHNHPFDKWTVDDYYGFASFLSQIGYKNAQDPRELTIFNSGDGEMRHPLGNRLVFPKYNVLFSRNFGNLVWAHFFGKGIIDPVDDARVSNPPNNMELLKVLAQKTVEYKFDTKKLVRDICLSRTYQLSTQAKPTNEWDSRNFARQSVRRMRAEILFDCSADCPLRKKFTFFRQSRNGWSRYSSQTLGCQRSIATRLWTYFRSCSQGRTESRCEIGCLWKLVRRIETSTR
jgi:hypothetical protein